MPPLRKVFYAAGRERHDRMVELRKTLSEHSKKVPGGINELAILWLTAKLDQRSMHELITG